MHTQKIVTLIILLLIILAAALYLDPKAFGMDAQCIQHGNARFS